MVDTINLTLLLICIFFLQCLTFNIDRLFINIEKYFYIICYYSAFIMPMMQSVFIFVPKACESSISFSLILKTSDTISATILIIIVPESPSAYRTMMQAFSEYRIISLFSNLLLNFFGTLACHLKRCS